MSQRRIKRQDLEKLRELHRDHKILQQPGIHHVSVAHDHWCRFLRGQGECNCNPKVSYVATEGQN